MFLYNVTIIVENDVHEAVKKRIETQLFGQHRADASVSLLEMLDSPHEGTTYCVQLRAAHEEEITAFQHEHLALIQTWINSDYAGKALTFESVMKYLSIS